MSNRRKRVMLWSAFSVCALVLLGMLLPLLAGSSNCGGNSAALAYSKMVLLSFQVAAGERGAFKPSVLSIEDRSDLARRMTRLRGWTGGATLLVRTNIQFTADSARRELVIVCDKQFGNVPKPTPLNLWRQNPSHAAGYSDGTVQLISLDAFRALNLSGFVDARVFEAHDVAAN